MIKIKQEVLDKSHHTQRKIGHQALNLVSCEHEMGDGHGVTWHVTIERSTPPKTAEKKSE